MQREFKSNLPRFSRGNPPTPKGTGGTIRRGRPDFAETQREKILQLLRQAGPMGVSREELIFRYRWTQCGARIFELEQQGYKIRHESRRGERLVVYVLESEPLEFKPLSSGADWYEEKFGPHPTAKRKETPANLPLFTEEVRQ